MRKPFALLLPAALLFGPGTVIAQEHDDHAVAPDDAAPVAMRTVRWSDPSAWPNGRVPGEGDAVTIARDVGMVLDVSPPPLRGVTVAESLIPGTGAIPTMTVAWVLVRVFRQPDERRQVARR